MDREALISKMVGESYPPAIKISNGQLRRNWIIRSAGPLPTADVLMQLEQKLIKDACTEIETAYGRVADGARLNRAYPSVTLIRLDELHLVVRIEFAGSQHELGDSAAISQWGILQNLDRSIELADVQGIPRQYWFPLSAASPSPG